MANTVALTTTHHDPEGRLYDQAVRLFPRLRELYRHITVVVTPGTPDHVHALLRELSNEVNTGVGLPTGFDALGAWRRLAIGIPLQADAAITHVHLCDLDRVLHWAEYYPDELHTMVQTIPHHDVTVLGRTARAFNTHPRAQRDTEALINHVFHQASGDAWDVTAASRGFSRRAAEIIIADCPDLTIGCDCSWLLFLQQQHGVTINYLQTEGLEFETLDRYGDEVAALGGVDAWIARFDADPRMWAQRVTTAKLEIDAVIAWLSRQSDSR